VSPPDAAVCARVMVAKGLLIEPGFVSRPFVATYQFVEKPVAVDKSKMPVRKNTDAIREKRIGYSRNMAESANGTITISGDASLC
jgi:hypothetical protein